MTTVDENFFKQYPESLVRALGRLAGRCSGRFYIAGGPVRDWLLGKESRDLDITLPAGSFECGRELSRQLKGAFVPLDEKEDVARTVSEINQCPYCVSIHSETVSASWTCSDAASWPRTAPGSWPRRTRAARW